MNIWKYREIVLCNLNNVVYDAICERNVPNGLLEKYSIRKDNIYKYDYNKSYIGTYFFDSPVHVIGYHLNNDKWYPIFEYKFHKIKAFVNSQFLHSYRKYMKRVKKRAILTLFLVDGFDANIISNIYNYIE